MYVLCIFIICDKCKSYILPQQLRGKRLVWVVISIFFTNDCVLYVFELLSKFTNMKTLLPIYTAHVVKSWIASQNNKTPNCPPYLFQFNSNYFPFVI